MTCWSRRAKNAEKRYRRNSVHPHPMAKQKVDTNFMENFLREKMHCGKCRKIFDLNSNELKIHCNICNQFFHCGIAGKCIGENCKIVKPNGETHHTSYCDNCVSIKYETGRCLCKDCAKQQN